MSNEDSLPSQLDQRLAELKARGEILPAKCRPSDYVFKPRPPAKRGSLKRFLDERNED